MTVADRERFGRICDAVVHGGIIALLAFSPLALGAVHPWARGIVQIIVALLLLTWAIKLRRCGSTTAASQRLRRWWAPLAAFAAVVVLQLLPLPPPLLRLLSPQTYALYEENLPGWPSAPPFEALAATLTEMTRQEADGSTPLAPTAPAVDGGQSVSSDRLRALVAPLSSPGRWRPLSVYAEGSSDELLRFAALSTLFFCSLATPGNRVAVVRRPPRWWASRRRTRFAIGCSVG